MKFRDREAVIEIFLGLHMPPTASFSNYVGLLKILPRVRYYSDTQKERGAFWSYFFLACSQAATKILPRASPRDTIINYASRKSHSRIMYADTLKKSPFGPYCTGTYRTL
jgi:hypothetical protein